MWHNFYCLAYNFTITLNNILLCVNVQTRKIVLFYSSTIKWKLVFDFCNFNETFDIKIQNYYAINSNIQSLFYW